MESPPPSRPCCPTPPQKKPHQTPDTNTTLKTAVDTLACRPFTTDRAGFVCCVAVQAGHTAQYDNHTALLVCDQMPCCWLGLCRVLKCATSNKHSWKQLTSSLLPNHTPTDKHRSSNNPPCYSKKNSTALSYEPYCTPSPACKVPVRQQQYV